MFGFNDRQFKSLPAQTTKTEGFCSLKLCLKEDFLNFILFQTEAKYSRPQNQELSPQKAVSLRKPLPGIFRFSSKTRTLPPQRAAAALRNRLTRATQVDTPVRRWGVSACVLAASRFLSLEHHPNRTRSFLLLLVRHLLLEAMHLFLVSWHLFLIASCFY